MTKFTPKQILYTKQVDDQTIVHFYQVIRATSNTCELREIRKRIHSQSFDEQEVGPVADEFVGPPIRKRITKTGAVIMKGRLYAWPWQGETMWQTAIIFMP